MLDLINIGISEDIIDQMIENNGINKVGILNKEYRSVQRIIISLREILISEDTINSLLIYMNDIFLLDYEIFLAKLKNKNILEVSEIINNNYEEAYDIFLKD